MNTKSAIFIYLLIFFCSCNQEQKNISNEQSAVQDTSISQFQKVATIQGIEVSLKQKKGREVLVYKNKGNEEEIELLIPGPVDFHKDKSGNVREVVSNDTVYFLVESSFPDSILTKRCRTHLQSVRLVGDRLSVSEIVEKVAACPPFQWDDYVFYSLFDKD